MLGRRRTARWTTRTRSMPSSNGSRCSALRARRGRALARPAAASRSRHGARGEAEGDLPRRADFRHGHRRYRRHEASDPRPARRLHGGADRAQHGHRDGHLRHDHRACSRAACWWKDVPTTSAATARAQRVSRQHDYRRPRDDSRRAGHSRLLRQEPYPSGRVLTVGEGETVTLLGRNGAGKTTTLKSITGLWRPRRGASCSRATMSRGSRPTASPGARRVLRAGAPGHLPAAERGGEPAARRAQGLAVATRRYLPHLPAPEGTAHERRRAVVGRRTADARDRPRADEPSAPPDARRAGGRASRP